jgi:leucine dehydrogenase
MINVFEHPEFKDHQEIHFFQDRETGLKAIIAIHFLLEGTAGGGCRFYPYAGSEEALTDVLRLSRTMTYKFILADVPMGGAKSVIIGNPQKHKTEALLESFGEKIDELNGKYIVGPDVGTNENDMSVIRRRTQYAAGAKETGGNTAPMTGYGVFKALLAAWQFQSGGKSLENVRVAIQGFGAVGYHLAQQLEAAGAQITVADLSDRALEKARELGYQTVSTLDLISQEVDILAPCALGGVLNEESLPKINARIICGGANNQLKDEQLITALEEKGILFIPDFISSAGGAIYGAGHLAGKSSEEIQAQADRIYDTTLQVLNKARQENISVLSAAYNLAEEKLKEKTDTQ